MTYPGVPAKGMLGQPHGGFPPERQRILLRGQEPITCRPGELLEPADLEAERRKAEERVGQPVDDRALVSHLLYPSVAPELARHQEESSDTSGIPTPVFLYGLEPGQETTIEIQAGKTLIVKLNTIGKLLPDGKRDLYFELNGEARAITVRDQAAQTGAAARIKAEKGNPRHVGAPMPGKVLKVLDFGAFVELEKGVEGLVHVSEIMDDHVDDPRKVLNPGQEVQALRRRASS